MSDRIEIADVRDFLNVPIDKLDHCLEDFRSYLAVANVARALDPTAKFSPFIWIDDGKHTAHISVRPTPSEGQTR